MRIMPGSARIVDISTDVLKELPDAALIEMRRIMEYDWLKPVIV